MKLYFRKLSKKILKIYLPKNYLVDGKSHEYVACGSPPTANKFSITANRFVVQREHFSRKKFFKTRGYCGVSNSCFQKIKNGDEILADGHGNFSLPIEFTSITIKYTIQSELDHNKLFSYIFSETPRH